MNKICVGCKTEKDLTEFSKHQTCKYGVNSKCFICVRKLTKKHYQDNPEFYKNIRSQDKEKKSEYLKNWRQRNPNSSKKFRENHPGYCKMYQRQRLKNPEEKLIHSLRIRTRKLLLTKGKERKKSSKEYLGCSKLELKEHLEQQFKPGMSWENYGEWEIDHIIPLNRANTEEEIYKLCHYKNLQPLWKIENRRKGTK